jgi:hypothetical protein
LHKVGTGVPGPPHAASIFDMPLRDAKRLMPKTQAALCLLWAKQATAVRASEAVAAARAAVIAHLIAAEGHARQYLKPSSDRNGTQHRCPEEEQSLYDFCSYALSALDRFCLAARIAAWATEAKQLSVPLSLSATPGSTAAPFERWSQETPFGPRLRAVLQSAEYQALKAITAMPSPRLTPARSGPFSETPGCRGLNAWYERDGNPAGGEVSLRAAKRSFLLYRRCLAELLGWVEATLEALAADLEGWAPGKLHALAQWLP